MCPTSDFATRSFRWVWSALVAGAAMSGLAGWAAAQDEDSPQAAAAENAQAVIERLPLVIRDSQSYQTPLHLEPAVELEIVAPIDGVVSSVLVKLGDKAPKQSEAARLESTERQLGLDRAKAAFEAARLEQEAAEGSAAALAAARLSIAKADLSLAEFHLEQAVLRMPFDATVTEIHVVPGEFVRAGQPVLTIADLTKLAADIPVDRQQVKAGDTLEIKVEDATVQATVEAIKPLQERFAPLRDLFLSIATARVIVDNASGNFADGQTVRSDLIPKHPVAEVPTIALGNTPEGQRRVQVIREGFVRDIGVELLGQEGDEYVFITGRLGPTDELVVKSSQELLDGMRVVPSAGTSADTPAARNSAPRPAARSPAAF